MDENMSISNAEMKVMNHRRILIMDILLLVRKKNMHLSLNTAFLMKKVF